jgi:hypothetical protein
MNAIWGKLSYLDITDENSILFLRCTFSDLLYLTALSVSRLYSVDGMMINEYGAIGGMRIGRGIRSTRIKPAPVPLCPLRIPNDLTWDRTRAAAVGRRRLIA